MKFQKTLAPIFAALSITVPFAAAVEAQDNNAYFWERAVEAAQRHCSVNSYLHTMPGDYRYCVQQNANAMYRYFIENR